MLASEIFALGSAVCIALSAMFVTELSGRIPLLRLARWQITAGFVLTALIASWRGGWAALTGWQVGSLAASGLFGIAIASTTYFATIYRIGPRLTALVFALASPFALIMGYVVLGETVSLTQLAGVGFSLAGLVVAIGIDGLRAPVAAEGGGAPSGTNRARPGGAAAIC